MLFRIAKVFSQPGLSDLIRSAEAGLERGSGGRPSLPSLLDSSNLVGEDREGVYNAARSCILELEGQGAKYSPVFGNEFRQVVGELLGSAERANEAASEMLKEIGVTKNKDEEVGMLVGIIQWMMGGSGGSQDTQA